MADATKYNMEENWKDIKGYEGLYTININGQIKSVGRKVKHRSGFKTIPDRIMSIANNTSGYKSISLCKNGIGKSYQLHRLVAIAFIPNPNNKPQVNHIDGNKQNNNINNLEWVSAKENSQHSYDNGLSIAPWLGKFGKDNKDSKPINQLTKEGVFIRTFNGIAEASRITGISKSFLSDTCRKKHEYAKNYKWEFANN
jgi:hypothetical protein